MSRSSAPESILSLYSPDVDLEENFLYGGGASILGRCISRLFFAHLSFFPHKNTLFFNAIPVSHTHRRAKPIHTSRLNFVSGSRAAHASENKQEKYTLAAVRRGDRKSAERAPRPPSLFPAHDRVPSSI
jgi:hypothetical protein